MNNAYTNLVASIKSEPIAEVIVFDGYSGLGYKNPDIVKETMYNEMKGKIGSMKAVSDALGVDSPPLYVVAGATADGIGMCYEVADRLKTEGFNIQTVGIVSSAATVEESWGKALPDEQAKRLNHLVVVDDPNNTWQVLNDKGQSLMVDIAFASGKPATFSFYGGGGVANSELKELDERLNSAQRNIEVVIRHGEGDFAPREDKAEKKYQQVMEKAVSKGSSPQEAAAKATVEINGTAAYQEGTFSKPIPQTPVQAGSTMSMG